MSDARRFDKETPMKSLIALAAVPMLVLAGCATTQKAGGDAPVAASAGAAGTYYCWKGRYVNDGGRLGCNWAASVADACKYDTYSVLTSRGAATEPQSAGRCANGEWLVMVTTR
jgi:predicted small secreted protein